jgi:flagellar basal-body rod modification protein FlgD
MAVQPLASIAASTALPGAGAPSPTTNAPLSQTDFLNLLTKQMQYQDPMNPMSATDFAAQLAQFSSLQGVQQLNTNFNQLLMLQQVSQGANLIGKTVTFAANGKALPSSGVVSSVNIANGSVQLKVGNQSIAMSQVTSIAAGTGN